MKHISKQHRFERLGKVIGSSNLELLGEKSVLILGCGGVGGYVVEESNINRQIIALSSTIGKYKVDVLEDRIKEINQDCKVIKVKSFIDNDNYLDLFQYQVDFFIDCCDTMLVKKLVMKESLKRNILFISSMGTGNKMDPSRLEIMDIRKTVNDPLARVLRKFVKDERISKKVMVLSSSELPIKTGDRTPGSTAFVPASAGLLIASYVVRYFIN